MTPKKSAEEVIEKIETLCDKVAWTPFMRGVLLSALDSFALSAREEALEACVKVAEDEKFIQGQTSVKFDSECLKETSEEPEVALRKMYNAACQNIVDGIRALKSSEEREAK